MPQTQPSAATIGGERRYDKFRSKFEQLTNDVDVPSFIRKYKAELRFPDKLVLLIMYVEQASAETGESSERACISWTQDGRAFIIRREKELMKRFVPEIFGDASKFSSFTRKLYRWGFHQKVGDIKARQVDGVKIFYHPHFQRDNRRLLVDMRSMTVERARMPPTALSDYTAASLDQQQQLSRGEAISATLSHPAGHNNAVPFNAIRRLPTAHPNAHLLMHIRMEAESSSLPQAPGQVTSLASQSSTDLTRLPSAGVEQQEAFLRDLHVRTAMAQLLHLRHDARFIPRVELSGFGNQLQFRRTPENDPLMSRVLGLWGIRNLVHFGSLLGHHPTSQESLARSNTFTNFQL